MGRGAAVMSDDVVFDLLAVLAGHGVPLQRADDMARLLGVSGATVKRRIQHLADTGRIQVRRGNSTTRRVYRIPGYGETSVRIRLADELVDYLAQAGAATVPQIALVLGIGRTLARHLVRRAFTEGRVTRARGVGGLARYRLLTPGTVEADARPGADDPASLDALLPARWRRPLTATEISDARYAEAMAR